MVILRKQYRAYWYLYLLAFLFYFISIGSYIFSVRHDVYLLIFELAIITYSGYHVFSELQKRDKNLFDNIFSGAYKDITFMNDGGRFGNFDIISATKYPKLNHIGSDIVSIKMVGDDVVIFVGDVNSHGEKTFIGAFLSAAVFGVANVADPALILKQIDSMLVNFNIDNGGSAVGICLVLKPNGRVIYSGYVEGFRLKIGGVVATVDQYSVFLLGLGNMPDNPDNREIYMRNDMTLLLETDGVYDLSHSDDMTSVSIKYLGADNGK